MTLAIIIIIAVLALVATGAILYAVNQHKKLAAAERVTQEFKAVEQKRDELAEKVEVIKNEQVEQKAKVDTGDPVADFTGSLDVLSDLSARRRKN